MLLAGNWVAHPSWRERRTSHARPVAPRLSRRGAGPSVVVAWSSCGVRVGFACVGVGGRTGVGRLAWWSPCAVGGRVLCAPGAAVASGAARAARAARAAPRGWAPAPASGGSVRGGAGRRARARDASGRAAPDDVAPAASGATVRCHRAARHGAAPRRPAPEYTECTGRSGARGAFAWGREKAFPGAGRDVWRHRPRTDSRPGPRRRTSAARTHADAPRVRVSPGVPSSAAASPVRPATAALPARSAPTRPPPGSVPPAAPSTGAAPCPA